MNIDQIRCPYPDVRSAQGPGPYCLVDRDSDSELTIIPLHQAIGTIPLLTTDQQPTSGPREQLAGMASACARDAGHSVAGKGSCRCLQQCSCARSSTAWTQLGNENYCRSMGSPSPSQGFKFPSDPSSHQGLSSQKTGDTSKLWPFSMARHIT